jgi:uncharacterized protein (DUF697 family)
LHLAAARSLPGLRPTVAHDLITGTAFSNGSYALLASVSEHFPVLQMTVSAADMLVLTKNQVLLVYKLALAHGAPAEFQANMREMLAVVGLAYVWRQVARSLIKLFPVVHIAPRVAVSYAGTYGVGVVAWRWFAYGELVSTEQLQHIVQEALEQGQHTIRMLQAQIHQDAGAAPER